MKTKILSLSVIAVMLFTINMQGQVKYGIHAAGNLETQKEFGELWNNADIYQGYSVGGFVEYLTKNTISLQAELNYQKKGQKFTPEGTSSTVRREFNYLTVPVLIKGNFHDGGLGDNWDLSVFTGPYAGFLTSAHSNIRANGKTSPVDINNEAEKTDFGLLFGAGASYKVGTSGAIILELRYQMGLSEVDKLDTDLRNKGMGITLGYRF
jgi:hypothetical protein